MAEPQLSVRSMKACELADRLARRERCSITDIVERALELYEARGARHEPAADFYKRLSAENGTDIDLAEMIRENGCR